MGISKRNLSKSHAAYIVEVWLMKTNYANPNKLYWLADAQCNVCADEVNSWDKRCSRALGYTHIVCESCIAAEYDVTLPELRRTMQEHFGLVPCPGI